MSNSFDIENGTKRTEWKNNLSGFKLDYSDLHGFSLYAFLQSPSDEEIQKYSINADLVVYFEDMKGVGFFVFNFSGTGGSSAFAPSLLLDHPTFDLQQPLNSFPFHVYLVDSSKGELKMSRSFTLSEKFAAWLSGWCKDNDNLNLSFDSVKEISKSYFDQLKLDEKRHDFKVAYATDQKCLLHERNH